MRLMHTTALLGLAALALLAFVGAILAIYFLGTDRSRRTVAFAAALRRHPVSRSVRPPPPPPPSRRLRRPSHPSIH
jgi:hypothetical protein